MSTRGLEGYYAEELGYLHDLAREFAAAHPDSAHLLADPSADPDVERLLEGLAFLTARLRGRLDDQMPELTQTLVEGIWPALLRPAPSATVIAFEPHAAAYRQVVDIPAGTMLRAREIEGTRCRFRTAWPLAVVPYRVDGAEWRRDSRSELRIQLAPLGATPAALGAHRLRFYCYGDPAVALALRHACTGLATGVQVVTPSGVHELGPNSLTANGFAADEALLPEADRSLAPLRLMQEYFCYREMFRFVEFDLSSVAPALATAEPFELVIQLSDMPEPAPPIGADNLVLNCVPAVNCFPHAADPMALDHRELEYRVHALDDGEGELHVHSVTAVTVLPDGGGAAISVVPASHRIGGDRDGFWFQVLRRPAMVGVHQDLFLSVSVPPAQLGTRGVLSIDALCTNGAAAERLGVGDVCVATSEVPPTVQFRNIVRPGPERLPPLGATLHWRYATQLDLHHHSIADRDRFVAMLDCYDLPALLDQRERERHRRIVDAIDSFTCAPTTVYHHGAALPGLAIELVASEDAFGGDGGLHLFGCVLERFCALYASINAATQLSLRARRSGRSWTFPARSGGASLL
ncbi:MAG: type VI secretion system baseplate subunit TssF [Planctomycetota bacterium]|jgi:type VI secretion system protein ImpG|nr:type VI secretion system baseplate subunit TssF [Planctomycetota bacterium]